jgi:hypothetical protein
VPEGLEALAALFILLPGFLSARLAETISSRNKQTELERIIEALLFSFFTYFIFVVCFSPQIPLSWAIKPDGAGAQHYVFAVDYKRFLALVGIAVFLGLVWGWLQGHDLVAKVLKKLRLTDRTSRESLWKDVFLSQRAGYVQVELADGRSALGYVSAYSDSGKERALFLRNAAWVTRDAQGNEISVDIPGPGLLLTDKSEIKYVMFLG